MLKTATPLNEWCTRARKFRATMRVLSHAITARETQKQFRKRDRARKKRNHGNGDEIRITCARDEFICVCKARRYAVTVAQFFRPIARSSCTFERSKIFFTGASFYGSRRC
jgi:hypothetical protein